MTEWHGGKGSRPRSKSPDKWDKGWEKIFNKAKEKVVEQSKKKQMSQNKKDRDCVKIVQKRLCNGEKPNCPPPSVSCILIGFRWLCGCAVAHACTYAHTPLKGALTLVKEFPT